MLSWNKGFTMYHYTITKIFVRLPSFLQEYSSFQFGGSSNQEPINVVSVQWTTAQFHFMPWSLHNSILCHAMHSCWFVIYYLLAPYGIREQTKKLEATDARKPHFMPPTNKYELGEVFSDLLSLASRLLRVGGRLVFWLPIYRPE